MKANVTSSMLVLFVLSHGSPAPAVTIETVRVGNAGNGADIQAQGSFGAVPYSYRIGKYEVTNSQYVEFLNGVDSSGTNSLELYDPAMTSSAHGGVNFNASAPGGAKFTVKAGFANRPAAFVSWYDSLRFVNWLHNGQGTGSTEIGAYTLLGNTPIPSNGQSVTRNVGARFFLPSEDEWYKAAYHKNDGVTNNYWDFPTESDATPSAAVPPGAISSPGSANFNSVVGSIANVGAYLSTDGTGELVSDGPYGTFDQGGNVWEWTEAPIRATDRTIRGGSWIETAFVLGAPIRGFGDPTQGTEIVGFRIATVPEPSAAILLALAFSAVCRLRRSSGDSMT